MPHSTISHYNHHARRYQAQYDSVSASQIHAAWSAVLADLKPGQALDVGAGSGRDAQWLTQKGWCVTAVEPAEGLRKLGEIKTGTNVLWVDAQLPTLCNLPVPEKGFDLILLSAVWMHLPVKERPQALQRLTECLSVDGTIIITLRFGPSDPSRPMYEVSVDELTQLSQLNGFELQVLSNRISKDQLQRSEVSWQTVCIRLSGDHGA